MAGAYRSGAHTKHRLRFYLVFVPKYRRRVLTGSVPVRAGELFGQVCAVNDWQLHARNAQGGHVPLLIQMPPKRSAASHRRHPRYLTGEYARTAGIARSHRLLLELSPCLQR